MTETESIAAVPALPNVTDPMSRRDLLLAAVQASSNYSAGIDDAASQRSLDGKPFTFRIRYCPGEATEGALRSRFDQSTRVWRVEARPDLGQTAAAIGRPSDPAYEAVEGFWIRKPWLLDPVCPAARVSPPAAKTPARMVAMAQADDSSRAPQAPAATTGIAQFFDDTSARSSRRGNRPYEFVRELPEGEVPGAVDFQLEGRLRGLRDGRVITCAGGSATTAPTCVISVRVDKVSLLDADGEALAEWGS